jgi:hypothetical protein
MIVLHQLHSPLLCAAQLHDCAMVGVRQRLTKPCELSHQVAHGGTLRPAHHLAHTGRVQHRTNTCIVGGWGRGVHKLRHNTPGCCCVLTKGVLGYMHAH